LLRTAVNNPSLASKLQVSMSDCFDYHMLINRIEYVADSLTSIAESIIELYEHRSSIPETMFQSLVDSAIISFDFYNRSVDTFFSDSLVDTGAIIDYADQNKFLDNTLQELPHDENEKQIVILCHSILENINRISNHTADIAELIIDRHYVPS